MPALKMQQGFRRTGFTSNRLPGRAAVALLLALSSAGPVPVCSAGSSDPAAAKRPGPEAAAQLSRAAVRALLYGDAARVEQRRPMPTVIVRPQWIGDGPRFWYEFRDLDGYHYVHVDPAAAERRELFDRERLASALTAATGHSVNWSTDRLANLEVRPGNGALAFEFKGRNYRFDPASAKLQTLESLSERLGTDDFSRSPDGRHAVFVRTDDLYQLDLRTGDERRLTRDGEPWYGYGRHFGSADSQKPLDQRLRWLPGSRRFVIERWDQRNVGALHITDWVGAGRAITRETRFAMPGDTQVPVQELWVFDVTTGLGIRVDTDRWPGQFVGHMDLDTHGILGARSHDRSLWFTRMRRGYDEIELVQASAATGESRVILNETAKPYITIRRPVFAAIDDGNEFLWLSDRSGWNHFYLFDDAGELKHAVTEGAYVAERIAQVDEEARELYFSAFGREPHLPAYFRQYYRINFDGSGIRRLTPENSVHEAFFSPDSRYFVDNHSRHDRPPVAVLRDRDGGLVLPLERLDTSRLAEEGFEPPQAFTATAADGKTPLHGLMWMPPGFDPAAKYPLVSVVQPNPGHSGLRFRFDPVHVGVALSRLGAVVIEARTRGQGRHVRNRDHILWSYGNPRDYPLADARATIMQLLDRHAFLDSDRIGVYGHSGGGFMAASLMLTYPELFSAGISSSGNHQNEFAEQNSGEYHWGVRCEDGHWLVDFPGNAELAGQLKGRLLLLHGDNDRDTHVGHTLRLARALQDSGKRFDMMIFPGLDHGIDTLDYHQRLVLAWFSEHLLGRQPSSVNLGALPLESHR